MRTQVFTIGAGLKVTASALGATLIALGVHRAGPEGVENLTGWLTTITARVCLNVLRARTNRRELSLEAPLPDPIVTLDRGAAQPEDQALLADSVGIALLLVLDTLTPAERLAFVLHDMFDLPFGQIAPMLDRTPEATRQLASRARRRITGADILTPDRDLRRQRAVVDALIALPHPDVVLRSDFARRPPRTFMGPVEVAGQALIGAIPDAELHNARVGPLASAVLDTTD